ncbi:hypothetical protein EPA93_15410 [Ktedonosporobacter rubrisoli]|uniref:Uncharacterized protein n=1 Tax=Ktedonosporobacter rubrisoli TaxID=2509675 RepID=A0A4P6JPY8_KTERU|nr:hypothetical protein [Ktedonosporobacter rubrisoli]QBD77303.1 hypothetical protein EPA93_15410 [Ktedonosporobacter rubrisoli]
MGTIFQLVDFDPNRHHTLLLKLLRAKTFFGEGASSSVILPQEAAWCRLVVKQLVLYPRGYRGTVMRQWFPWGDLFMMRKQLVTLRKFTKIA